MWENVFGSYKEHFCGISGIITRVCIVADFGTSADCAEETFTSKNVSMVTLHLRTKDCIHIGQQTLNIGWFMDRPLQQWIAKCWNKNRCQVQIGGDARQVRVGVLMGTEGGNAVITPSACFLGITPQKGNVSKQDGHGAAFDCKDGAHLQDLSETDSGRGTVQWLLPAIFYNQFTRHTTTQKRNKHPPFQDSGRVRRSLYGDEIFDTSLPNVFSSQRDDVKDIIFDDEDDSSDMFTGELTTEEKIWDDELPESVDPVMTFPDDSIDRLPLLGDGRSSTGKKKKKKFWQRKMTRPAKGMRRISSGGHVLPLKMAERKEGPKAASVSETESVQGKDMLKALEDNIEEKLQSSLVSLMKNENSRRRAKTSMGLDLGRKNKIHPALDSVEKKPFWLEENEVFLGPTRPQASTAWSGSPAGSTSPQPPSEKKDTPGTIFAKTLPAPDHTISNINKPRMPVTSKPKQTFKTETTTTTAKPTPTTQQKPTSTQTVNPTKKAGENSTSPKPSSGPPPEPLPPRGNATPMFNLVPEDEKTSVGRLMEGNVMRAETIFRASFNLLRQQMAELLHIKLYPGRMKLLHLLESGIQKTMHVTAWAMVKQVCQGPLKQMQVESNLWLDWSGWSACSATCGSSGYHVRRRSCEPENVCSGSNFDLKPCIQQPECQGFVTWLDWSEWSRCSATCGKGGRIFRSRICLTDDPQVICKGQGTEFMVCFSYPCPRTKHKKRKHHKKHPPAGKAVEVSWMMAPGINNTSTTAPSMGLQLSTTTSTPSATLKPMSRRWKKKKRVSNLKPMLWNRSKQPHGRSAVDELESMDYLETVEEVDEELGEMQDLFGQKKLQERLGNNAPFQSLDAAKAESRSTTASPHEEEASLTWSAWGVWSSCSVTCGKGTLFRRRECLKPIGDTFEGEAMKHELCGGQNKDKRYCSVGPCPLSVSIPVNLLVIEEGRSANVTCNNSFKEVATGLYWITPDGERITNKTRTSKYRLDNLTLTIQNTHKSDLGEYLCILLPPSMRQMMPAPSLAQSGSRGPGGAVDSLGAGNIDICSSSPCKNGGTCQPVVTVALDSSGHSFYYHCMCVEGFYGKHCEQKSLVHEQSPNLQIMAIILFALMAMLCLFCTGMCVHYRIEARKHRVGTIRPVMTRRRSEDQWRKMKSYDQKGRYQKKNFVGSDKMAKRLSLFPEEEEDGKNPASFGVEDNPETTESVVGADNNVTEIPEKDFEKFNEERRMTADLGQPSQLEHEVKQLLNDSSQNASPPTVGGGEAGSCYSQVDRDFGNTQRRWMDSPPTLQVNPTVIYSDDRMQIFAHSDSSYQQDIEDRIAKESYNPFCCTSEESISGSRMHIFKSKVRSSPNEFQPQSLSSRPRHRSKRKRRAKRNCERRSSGVEHEFNQNYSDDGSEGSTEHSREGDSDGTSGRASASSQQRNAQASGCFSFSSRREDRLGHLCSSPESGKEVEEVSRSAGGTDTGPAVKTGSKHKLEGSVSEDSTRSTQSGEESRPSEDKGSSNEGSQNSEGAGVQTSRSPGRFSNADDSNRRKTFPPKFYEVKHPDEPYPYRLSRSKRKARDSQEQHGYDKSGSEGRERHRSEEDSGRPEERSSGSAEAQGSTDATGQHRRSHSTSPQNPQHLEGGGEGAAAASRSELRKSTRDVLLRKAMENSFIQATMGLDFRRSLFPNSGQSPTDARYESLRQVSPAAHRGSRGSDSLNQLDGSWLENQNLMDVGAAQRFTSTPVKLQADLPEQSGSSQPHWGSSSGSCNSPSPHPKPARRTRSKLGLQSAGRFLEGRSTGALEFSVCDGHRNNPDSSDGLFPARRRLSITPESLSRPFQNAREESCRSGDFSFDSKRHFCHSGMVKPVSRRQEYGYETTEEGNSTAVFSSFDDGGRSHWRRMCEALESEKSGYFGNQLLEDGQCSFHTPYRLTQPQNQAATFISQGSEKVHATEADAGTDLPTRNPASSSLASKAYRGLKSAMKQHSSLSKVNPSVEKRRAPRRVSFSEPKVHQRNEMDLLLEDLNPKVGEFDSISQRDGGPLAMDGRFDDISRRPCGPLDLDSFFSLPGTSASGSTPTDRGKNSPQSTGPTPGAEPENFLMTTGRMESLRRENMDQFSQMDPASCRERQASKKLSHYSTDTCSADSWCSSIESQPQGEMASPRFSDKGNNCHRKRQWVVEPPLLVDIEPQGNDGDISSESKTLMPRGETPMALQFLSRPSLMSPLTPTPSTPTSEHAEQDEQQSQSTPHSMYTVTGTVESAVEGVQASKSTPSTSSPSFTMPFNSFQEMLAVRTPGAFFKPIKKGERDKEPAT